MPLTPSERKYPTNPKLSKPDKKCECSKNSKPSKPDKKCGCNKTKQICQKKRQKEKKPRANTYWHCLPDIVLEEIFSMLTIRDRYYASQVCRNWNRIFYSSKVWHTFILDDFTLTRRKFNYYMGYQHVLDHYRTSLCLNLMGKAFRRIIITPMESYFNLYEFMTIASYFAQRYEERPLKLVHTLDFTFSCHAATEADEKNEYVFGTGGKLLESLKKMMASLEGLKHLSLQDLLLDKAEAMGLLDDVAYSCCESLLSLRLINCTKETYSMLHAGVFVNLRKLTISPQHLGDDLISLLGNTRLRDLYVIQTKHTAEITSFVSPKVWKECKSTAPFLKVHQLVEGKIKTEIVWQEGAAVHSVIYNTPYARVTVASVLNCSALYAKDLEVYAFLKLPRFYMPRPFQDRADSSLILLCRTCPKLQTLVIRERISTSTVLLIAYYAKNIRRLIVRRNSLIKKCDWPHNPEWSDEFYEWLRKTSKSYEDTAKEVSLLVGFRWEPINDNEFKLFRL